MANITIERVPTGIPGLDVLIEGGFVKNSVTRIAGTPGTGKTIATGQCAATLAKLGYKVGIFCFEETPEEIKQQLAEFGLDLSNVKFFSADDMTYDSMLGKKPQDRSSQVKLLLENAKKAGLEFVIIDSMSSLLMEDGLHERLLVRQLIHGLKKLGVTSLVTSEATKGEKDDDIASYLADNDILLSMQPALDVRNLEIRKMRSTKHTLKPQNIVLTDKGLSLSK